MKTGDLRQMPSTLDSFYRIIYNGTIVAHLEVVSSETA